MVENRIWHLPVLIRTDWKPQRDLTAGQICGPVLWEILYVSDGNVAV